MDFLAVAGLCGALVSIIGFVGVFVKIGVDKGESNQRMAAVERQAEKNTKDIIAIHEDVHRLEKTNLGTVSKLESDIKYIIMMLGEIKDDLKAGKRRGNAETKPN